MIQALRAHDLRLVLDAIQSDRAALATPRPIVEAARLAFGPAVKLLHKNGADLNASWRNYRPLHALIQTDPHEPSEKPGSARLACLDWLLEHGANPEMVGGWPSARALVLAAFVGAPEYVERLRNARARIDGFTGAALADRVAVKHALRDVSNFARERDEGGLTALQCVAGSRMPDVETVSIAQLLLDSGADASTTTRSWSNDVNAAYFAVSAQNRPMFELLLNRGADSTDAFSHAVWAQLFGWAELAMALGAKPDLARANNKPLLNDLIRWGRIPATIWLLERGASPNIPDDEGWTAVHQAVSRGNVRLLGAVLEAGGDRSAVDMQRRTPLDIAREMNRPKLVEMLSR